MGEATHVKPFAEFFHCGIRTAEENVLLSLALCVGMLLHSQRVFDLGVGV